MTKQRLYARVKTNIGLINLAITAKNEEEAKRKVKEKYKVNEIVCITNKPIQTKRITPSIRSFSENLVSTSGLLGNRTSKRLSGGMG